MSPVLRAPELDAGLQVGSHQSGVEGQNPLPQPAGHTSLDAVRDMAGLLDCENTLLGPVELLVNYQQAPSPSPQGCCQSILQPACLCAWDCPDPLDLIVAACVETRGISSEQHRNGIFPEANGALYHSCVLSG